MLANQHGFWMPGGRHPKPRGPCSPVLLVVGDGQFQLHLLEKLRVQTKAKQAPGSKVIVPASIGTHLEGGTLLVKQHCPALPLPQGEHAQWVNSTSMCTALAPD